MLEPPLPTQSIKPTEMAEFSDAQLWRAKIVRPYKTGPNEFTLSYTYRYHRIQPNPVDLERVELGSHITLPPVPLSSSGFMLHIARNLQMHHTIPNTNHHFGLEMIVVGFFFFLLVEQMNLLLPKHAL